MLDIQKLFIKKAFTLSLAESCTGGLLASILTKTAGCSNYFLGSFVTYNDQMKIDILGVDECLIKEKTSVCADVAEQMCIGALKKSNSDYAIAVTGQAGPDGDNIGLVYGAIGSNEKIHVGKIPQLKDLSREQVQQKSSAYLLLNLYNLLAKGEVPFANK